MRLRSLGALFALAIAVTGCQSGIVKALPPAPPVSVLPTTTTVPDFSGTSIPAVKGTTTTAPVRVTGGTASISGKVTIEGAPTAGVDIRIDRYVGDNSAGIDAMSAADGSFSFGGLQGGRYRIRAYRTPDSTLVTPVVFLLGEGQNSTQNLNLTKFNSTQSVNYNVAPNPPRLGDVANVVVQVTTQGVDSTGTAKSVGQSGLSITLASAGGQTVISPNPTTTDGNGKAVWEIRCDNLFNPGLTALMPDGSTVNVNVPGCAAPAPTTTTSLDTEAPQ